MKRLWIVAALVGLAACGKTTVTAGGTPITYSNSPTSLVVQVDVSGGFVPVETVFTSFPVVSIYGDGTVITTGPQTMIYPGAVVPNLLVRKLDATGMQTVLTAAQAAGILTTPPIDYGQPPVADVPDTVVTVNANDTTYTQSANALGMEDATSGLTQAQIDERAKLSTFVDSMTDLETLVGADHIGPDQPYVVTGWRLRATVADQLPTGEPAPTVTPWPIASLPLASIGECTAVTEPATVAQVTDTMTKANQLTFFTDAGKTYQVLVRPLLPDETGC